MEVLAGLPWVAAEVPKGYFSSQDVPLRSVGSKPQAELPSLEHQSQKGTQVTSICEKQQEFSLSGRDSCPLRSVGSKPQATAPEPERNSDNIQL